MPQPEGVGAGLIREHLAKFPDITTRSLAEMLWKQHSALWTSYDSCRRSCRQIRGQAGKYHRQVRADKTLFADGKHAGFPSLPQPIVQLQDWHAEKVEDHGTWLVMSDIHIPFHDNTSIRVCLSEAKKYGKSLSGILINGDLCDCHALSHFHKDPRTKDFPGEIGKTREFFWTLRKAFPKLRIIWKWGNHEERYDQYMQIKCPEFLGLASFDYGNLAGAADYGVQVVRDKRPVKLGKLWTLHGHEYRRTFGDPVNAARWMFLRARVSGMCGHFHKSSQHSAKDLGDDVVSCWSTGCLCNLRLEWFPLNEWNHGAAFVHLFRDMAYEVDNFRVINGRKWS